jgi:hypothetical protein
MITIMLWWFGLSIVTALIVGRLILINPKDDEPIE